MMTMLEKKTALEIILQQYRYVAQINYGDDGGDRIPLCLGSKTYVTLNYIG